MSGASGQSTCALLVAAQICDPSGIRRADPAALDLLRRASGELAAHSARLLALPVVVAPDGVLSVTPYAPEGVVDIVLAIAAAARPEHTTFCVTMTMPDDLIRERPEDALARTPARDLETAVLGAHAADASARAGLSETDHRISRVRVLGPGAVQALAAAIDLLLEAYDSMTERQRQIIQLVKSLRTQQDVATHLGISRQAVNQSLTSARWPHLDSAERHISASLSALCATPPTKSERGGVQ